MRLTLKIASIISVCIGGVAILQSFSATTDAGYTFLGGLMFGAIGIIALCYISQVDKQLK